MQVMIVGELNHDDAKQTLVITDAYLEGTKPQIRMPKIVVPPGAMVQAHLSAFVLPFIAEEGKPCVTRFILVDQFQRKYKTNKFSFRYIPGSFTRTLKPSE